MDFVNENTLSIWISDYGNQEGQDKVMATFDRTGMLGAVIGIEGLGGDIHSLQPISAKSTPRYRLAQFRGSIHCFLLAFFRVCSSNWSVWLFCWGPFLCFFLLLLLSGLSLKSLVRLPLLPYSILLVYWYSAPGSSLFCRGRRTPVERFLLLRSIERAALLWLSSLSTTPVGEIPVSL